MSTSEAVILIAAPRIMMPGEGAVWPAMRSWPLRMVRSEVMPNRAGHFEHAGARDGGIDAGLERTRAVGVEIGHPVDRAAAAGFRLHAKSGSARDHRNRLHAGRAAQGQCGG